MPPIPYARSSAHARCKRALLFRRAALALSTPLRKQRTPHPSTPTKCLHLLQIPPLLQQISPARSPSRLPAAPRLSPRADKQPRTPAPAAHSQTPPPKPFPPRPLPPLLLAARLPRSVSRKLQPKLSPLSSPPAPR